MDRSRDRDKSEEADPEVADNDGWGPTDKDGLSLFLKGRKRLDDRPITMVLNDSILDLFFDTLIGAGEFDKQAREDMRAKYYLSEKQFEKLAAPTLEKTKIHAIHGAERLNETLLHLHSSHRTAMKFQLRTYETLGSVSRAFTDFVPGVGVQQDGLVNSKHALPSYADTESSVTDADIETFMEGKTTKALAKEAWVNRLLVKEQKVVHDRTVKDLLATEKVAEAGNKLHETLSELQWDGLQVSGQHDLSIKRARENAYKGQLTASFEATLRNIIKDKKTKREKDEKDAMLHPDLDKVAKEESKTDTKMSLIVKG